MPPKSAVTRDLERLEAELRQLEAEYNMFFSGGLPRPPWEARARVEAIVKQLDRGYIENTGERFRFTTLQSRFATFVDLWDRGLRARDEGRQGPPGRTRHAPQPEKRPTGSRVVHVAAFHDLGSESGKLRDLYDSLATARRQSGEPAVPFHKFASLVQQQVRKLTEAGTPDVAFRVAIKDGRVTFTARGLKGVKD